MEYSYKVYDFSFYSNEGLKNETATLVFTKPFVDIKMM